MLVPLELQRHTILERKVADRQLVSVEDRQVRTLVAQPVNPALRLESRPTIEITRREAEPFLLELQLCEHRARVIRITSKRVVRGERVHAPVGAQCRGVARDRTGLPLVSGLDQRFTALARDDSLGTFDASVVLGPDIL